MELYIKEIPYFDPFQLVVNLPNKNFVFLDGATHRCKNSRYSFIAYDPFSIITYNQGVVTIDGIPNKKPLLEILSDQLKLLSFPNNFLPFCGGLAGYINYELIKYFEPKINFSEKDSSGFPDLTMGIFDLVVGFDNLSQQCWIYSSGLPEKNEIYRMKRARERCQLMMSIISQMNNSSSLFQENFLESFSIKCNLAYSDYCQQIKKVLDYIQAGDIYQANISQQFSCELPDWLTPLQIYHRLRTKNPAPFSSYLNFDGNIIASASPERFISVQNSLVTTQPIKGTTSRSSDPLEDKIRSEKLYNCTKNRAENLMIVDLMRNDLSKVCELFSVNVPELFKIESFATVHHLISTVQGKLKKDSDVFDLIKATFPAGSITGAPKIRAIEIIGELETKTRGPYCGTIGYFGFNGTMDSSVVIRTFVIKNKLLRFNVGGGIVADSNAQDEYKETLIKAAALFATLTNCEIMPDQF